MARCHCADGAYPGFVLRENGADPAGNPYRVWEPCSSCMGSLTVHCCDGDCSQPEPEGTP